MCIKTNQFPCENTKFIKIPLTRIFLYVTILKTVCLENIFVIVWVVVDTTDRTVHSYRLNPKSKKLKNLLRPADEDIGRLTGGPNMNYTEKEGFLSKKGVKIRANPWCKRLKTTEVWYLRWTNPRRTLKLSTAADVSLQWSCRKDAVNGRNSLIDKLLETYGRKTTSKVVCVHVGSLFITQLGASQLLGCRKQAWLHHQGLSKGRKSCDGADWSLINEVLCLLYVCVARP